MSRRKSIVAISAALILTFTLCSILVPTSGVSLTGKEYGGAVRETFLGLSRVFWTISDGVLGWLALFSLPSSDHLAWVRSAFQRSAFPGDEIQCIFPLPSNLLTDRPVQRDNPDFQKAAESLRQHFSARTSQADIDSLAIAVVTPAGVVFEEGYGVLKANDTSGKQYAVDGHSIYRIASVTKVFTVFETLLLRERGLLDFDDPVEKYVPEFSPPSLSYGWSDYLSDRSKEHTGHTAGLGRDYPLIDLPKWPTEEGWPPPSPIRNTTFKNVLGSINRFPSVNLPYLYPIYSNAGFDMLGLANVGANLKAGKHRRLGSQPKTHKELVKRDIFDAFGLNSSFYRVPEDEELRAHIAIPAQNSDWADSVLGDVDDAAGGQYSSLSDLAKFMHLILSPNPPKDYAFLPSLVREWLRPLHIWPDGTEAVGAPWEIEYPHLPPWYQKQTGLPIYWKLGNMPGYHSLFGLNPEYGYGIVILVTGKYGDTRALGRQALHILQPAFRKVLEDQVREAYLGEWEVASGGKLDGHSSRGLVIWATGRGKARR
ncbi:hypothetical protein H1R20_g1822, partial [Candolleomyces eurysporus]